MRLSNGYILQRYSENGLYYVVGASNKGSDATGAFDGVVDEIAWDGRTILANVHRSYRGDSDGYYWIDVKTGVMSGPVSKDFISNTARLKNLKVIECSKILIP